MKKLIVGLGFVVGGYLLYKKMTQPQTVVTSDNTSSANYISADTTSAGGSDGGGAGPMRLMAGLRRPIRMK